MQHESQVMQQESPVIQDFQITQQHKVQVTQDKEFQNTQVIQDNSSIMQEFNTTIIQVKSQVSCQNIHKKKPKLTYKEVQAKLNKPF
ncbi:7649_t:CDS:1, partial [Dentiscutata heterogama]